MMFESTPKILTQEIKDSFLDEHGIKLFVRREDLVHPFISGNKWRKLKYNLLEAQRLNLTKLVTFGGAYSNHIAASAAAGNEFGFQTVGVIRGEEMGDLNPTLKIAQENGMKFIYVSREDYRGKSNKSFIDKIIAKTGPAFLIPEGGANYFGVKGCAEILEEDAQYDLVCSACGTGGTLAGIVTGLKENQHAIGFPALKNAGFLENEIKNFLTNFDKQNSNWHLELDYHFGGYAKQNADLISFIQKFWKNHKLKLDPIYTGKMMFGIYDLIKQGKFKNQSILAIHTGGIQGVEGFEQRYKLKLFSDL